MHSRERQRGGHEGVYLMQTISLPVFTCSSSFFLLDSCRLGFFFFFLSVCPAEIAPSDSFVAENIQSRDCSQWELLGENN